MPGTETRKLKNLVGVRLTDETAVAVARQAAADGVSDASWIRALVVDAVQGSEQDVQPQPRPEPPPSEHLLALGELAHRVGEVGGLLVQTAKTARESGDPAHGDIEQALADVRALSREIRSAMAEERGRR